MKETIKRYKVQKTKFYFKICGGFLFHTLKLVIEIDGYIHLNDEQSVRDENPTIELQNFGLKVIRFKNDEIVNNLNNVIAALESYFVKN